MKSDVSMQRGRRVRVAVFGGPSLLEIAFHEAGHAVLAWVTGRKIERVSMVTDAQYARLRPFPTRSVPAGCLVVAPLPAGVDLLDERYRRLAEREAMIALAGELAVSRLRGSCRAKGLSRGDLDALTYAAFHAGDSPGCLDSQLSRIAAQTALYLEVYWSHVEALADALLRRRNMSGRQVIAILSGVERLPSLPFSLPDLTAQGRTPARRT
jgi:hypothetical protein